MFEQLFAHWTGDGSVLVADEAADLVFLLKRNREDRTLVAVRK